MEENTRNYAFTHERRKLWKKNARAVLKRHYALLVLIVLFAGVLGIEKGYFANTNDISDARSATAVTQMEGSGGVAGQLFGSLFLSSEENKKTVSAYEYTDEEKAELKEAGVVELSGDPVVDCFLSGKFKLAGKYAQKEIDNYSEAKANKQVLGRKAGVLAGIVNDVSSGSVTIKIAQAINSIIKSKTATTVILILVALAIYILVWMFLINTYRVVMRRIFLEARTYEKVDSSHILFLKTVKKWKKASITLLLYRLYLALWSLTIIGGIIKHYSYWAVPYIVAENPDIDPKEAITLSRRMMNGRKWETFKYECTFIGWYVLSTLTGGILQLFFVAPYKLATDAELYAVVRSECREDKLEGVEKLNDAYLFEKASEEKLEEAYGDILTRNAYIEEGKIKLAGARKFFADNFGLWIGSIEEQKRYEAYEGAALEVKSARECAEGISYPERLSELWQDAMFEAQFKKDKEAMRALNAMKSYSIWSVILLFFAFAFIGWSWEVLLHIVKDGVFVNRGTMHGPWLPIYGSGGVMILLILKKFRYKPWLEAIMAVILCGVLEYSASFYLELKHGIRWWDYTGYFLNLNGRICAEGLTVFAIGGCAVVYVVAPALDRYIQKIRINILIPICLLLVTAFGIDMVYSSKHPNAGKGITDYNRYKEAESYLPLQDNEMINGELRC